VSKITESARGEACTLRLDKCNGFEGVVFAHKNGAGMGQKFLDEDGKDVGAYLCYYCHQVYDGGIRHEYYNKLFVEEMFEFAIRETNNKLQKKGLI
tara:strand:- start:83 stop:370 length:288 start_codon:yes stop_codon:yes gene_type:complete